MSRLTYLTCAVLLLFFNPSALAQSHSHTVAQHSRSPVAWMNGYTLVLVKPAPDGTDAGATFGWNPLIACQGKIVAGEPVNLAGHVSGPQNRSSWRGSAYASQSRSTGTGYSPTTVRLRAF